ncbi:MAG TPA: alpha/beta hydrolase-fold protein [Opitutaceae bacterium]|nr:alpha/beta hydrolase-fold protein [Opitutaceae bacterium]
MSTDLRSPAGENLRGRFVAALVALIAWLIGVAAPPASAQTPARADHAAVASSAMDAGAPVTIPFARQFDLTSKVNGQQYRIMVSAPRDAKPGATYPVVYILDGNYYFATACETVFINKFAAIIVGIAYPTDDYAEIINRRTFDMTISASSPGRPAGHNGGGDAFLRMIEEDVKPFIHARYPADANRQTLYGCSLGGLMVLRQIFRHPAAYSTYIAASPAMWWNNNEVLADEAAFSKQVKTGALHLKLLITSAADEQYRGTDPAQLAAAARTRMVDNAAELSARLAAVMPENLSVTYTVFAGENHVSSSEANLSRGLRFALQPR